MRIPPIQNCESGQSDPLRELILSELKSEEHPFGRAEYVENEKKMKICRNFSSSVDRIAGSPFRSVHLEIPRDILPCSSELFGTHKRNEFRPVKVSVY